MAVLVLTGWQAQAAVSPGHTIFRRYLHSAVRFSGRLWGTTGHPARRVAVVVYTSSLSNPTSGMRPIAFSATDNSGRYSITTPKGPTRLLVLEGEGDQVRVVRENVSPSLWLKVRARSHHRLVFYGGLFLDRSIGMPPIAIQDKTPYGWRTFGLTVPNSAGHFRFVYHPDRGSRGFRLGFRALTYPSNTWLQGASSTKVVRVP